HARSGPVDHRDHAARPWRDDADRVAAARPRDVDHVVDERVRALVRLAALVPAVLRPGRRPGSGWGITLLGLAISYVGLVAAAQVLATSLGASSATGGRVGRALATFLSDLVTPAGAFVLLVGLFVLGIVIGFGIPLRQLTKPAVGSAKWFGSTAAASLRRTPVEGDGTSTGVPVGP